MRALDLIIGALVRRIPVSEGWGGEQTGAPRHRAASLRLAKGCLRRLGEIDAHLARFLDRPLPAGAGRVQAILRLMAAEILFTGTSPHAAVSEAVALAGSHRQSAPYAPLVNAVGRRLTELPAPMPAPDEAARLNAPDWFVRRCEEQYGVQTANALLRAHMEGAPVDLTVRDAAMVGRAFGCGKWTPSGSLRLNADAARLKEVPGWAEGQWWVQDSAAAIPARLLHPRPRLRALDMCAAPGGKTLQLAAAGADVTALDASETRLRRLERNLLRTGLHAACRAIDALSFRRCKPFDLVLLDAPCSASGIVRRHPDVPWLRDGSEIPSLARVQERFLQHGFSLLKPGGRLIYTVCSLWLDEGEAIAEDFLSRNAQARLVPIREAELPGLGGFVSPEGWLRTRPDQWGEIGGLDGFFAFRVTREKATRS